MSLWDDLFGTYDKKASWPFPTYTCKYCEAVVYVGQSHYCGTYKKPEGVTETVKPLTEADVRRIVKEELLTHLGKRAGE